MTVEVAFNFEDLNANLPDDLSTVDGAPILEDAEHARLIKNVMKLVLKGVTGFGFSVPIIAYEDELNYCKGLLSNLQTQITTVKRGSIPIGACVMYSGLFSNIPGNFALADGAAGTPNLSSKFVYGTNTENQVGATGGSNDSVNVSHNHSANHNHTSYQSDIAGSHTHNIELQDFNFGTLPYIAMAGLEQATPNYNIPTEPAGAHSHTVTVATALVTAPSPTTENGIGKNIPPFYTLAWIQRIT